MLRTSWLVLEAFLLPSFLFVDIPFCRIPLVAVLFYSDLVSFPLLRLCMT
jgi:hypothetical protein